MLTQKRSLSKKLRRALTGGFPHDSPLRVSSSKTLHKARSLKPTKQRTNAHLRRNSQGVRYSRVHFELAVIKLHQIRVRRMRKYWQRLQLSYNLQQIVDHCVHSALRRKVASPQKAPASQAKRLSRNPSFQRAALWFRQVPWDPRLYSDPASPTQATSRQPTRGHSLLDLGGKSVTEGVEKLFAVVRKPLEKAFDLVLLSKLAEQVRCNRHKARRTAARIVYLRLNQAVNRTKTTGFHSLLKLLYHN